MQSSLDRRRFLASSLAVTGALATAGASPAVFAAEPVRRTPGHKFKFSLAAYSYRNFLTGKTPELTLVDFIDDCAKMNLEGTELTAYYFPQAPTDEYLRMIKAECFRRGLDISGTAVGNDFCHPAGEDRTKQIDYVKRWIDYADKMGAPVIRIFSGVPKANQSPEEAHRLAVAGMEECCQYAGERGIFLALENHGGLTVTADGILSLVKDVKSPWMGINLDTGNFHSSDAYAELAQIAPYAMNVQVKVTIKPQGGEKQPSDFKRLASILGDAGYRGYIVLEYEENEDPRKACPRHIDELRAAFV